MTAPVTWLGIAFLRGTAGDCGQRLVMDATLGPFVHTEVLLGRGSDVRAYSSFGNRGGFVPSPNRRHDGPWWCLVKFPLCPDGGYQRAYAVILQLIALALPYNENDLWQCCCKLFLPFEGDLDCSNPASWTGGVFCSQVALLLLRRFLRSGILPQDGRLQERLESFNSRGCSPNTLFSILAA